MFQIGALNTTQQHRINELWDDYGAGIDPAQKYSVPTLIRLETREYRVLSGEPMIEPPPQIVTATREMIADYFDLVTLDQLKTDHLPPAKAAEFKAMLEKVRGLVQNGKSIFIHHPDFGIGKTHILKAVVDAYKHPITNGQPVFKNGKPDFRLRPYAKFFKSRDLMRIFENPDPFRAFAGLDLIAIDEVGVEGTLQYVAASEQVKERQNRYFQIIDHCYERDIRLSMTTNITRDQMVAFFDGRTLSRIRGLLRGGSVKMPDGLVDYRSIEVD